MARYTFPEQKTLDRIPFSNIVLVYFDEQSHTFVNEMINEVTNETTTTNETEWTYLRVKVEDTIAYPDLVNEMIRVGYSQSDVEAIFRHKIAGEDEGEFDKFNAFTEACKRVAKAIYPLLHNTQDSPNTHQ